MAAFRDALASVGVSASTALRIRCGVQYFSADSADERDAAFLCVDTAVSALRVTVLCESADAAAGIVRANAKTAPLAAKTTLRICTSPPNF
ncbi:hypothetical protein GCM10010376_17820 [Streptomyces violaceusniger]